MNSLLDASGRVNYLISAVGEDVRKLLDAPVTETAELVGGKRPRAPGWPVDTRATDNGYVKGNNKSDVCTHAGLCRPALGKSPPRIRRDKIESPRSRVRRTVKLLCYVNFARSPGERPYASRRVCVATRHVAFAPSGTPIYFRWSVPSDRATDTSRVSSFRRRCASGKGRKKKPYSLYRVPFWDSHRIQSEADVTRARFKNKTRDFRSSLTRVCEDKIVYLCVYQNHVSHCHLYKFPCVELIVFYQKKIFSIDKI